MNELRKQAKGSIQMEEMLRFKNKVRQIGRKKEKGESNAKVDSHKSDTLHKSDKCQPLLKRPRYKRYTPLTTNNVNINHFKSKRTNLPSRLEESSIPLWENFHMAGCLASLKSAISMPSEILTPTMSTYSALIRKNIKIISK